MRTKPYTLRAAKNWRERKVKDGWQYYSVFASPELIQAVKLFVQNWRQAR